MLYSNGQFECFYSYEESLGKGGFGSVVKVVNVYVQTSFSLQCRYALDGREYAVKIAQLSERTSMLFVNFTFKVHPY